MSRRALLGGAAALALAPPAGRADPGLRRAGGWILRADDLDAGGFGPGRG